MAFDTSTRSWKRDEGTVHAGVSGARNWLGGPSGTRHARYWLHAGNFPENLQEDKTKYVMVNVSDCCMLHVACCVLHLAYRIRLLACAPDFGLWGIWHASKSRWGGDGSNREELIKAGVAKLLHQGRYSELLDPPS